MLQQTATDNIQQFYGQVSHYMQEYDGVFTACLHFVKKVHENKTMTRAEIIQLMDTGIYKTPDKVKERVLNEILRTQQSILVKQ